jgi:hypothetical protein
VAAGHIAHVVPTIQSLKFLLYATEIASVMRVFALAFGDGIACRGHTGDAALHPDRLLAQRDIMGD